MYDQALIVVHAAVHTAPHAVMHIVMHTAMHIVAHTFMQTVLRTVGMREQDGCDQGKHIGPMVVTYCRGIVLSKTLSSNKKLFSLK